MNMLKSIFSLATLLLVVLPCSKKNTIAQSNPKKDDFSLTETEIKFIYHEAVRRLFYEKDILLSIGFKMDEFYTMKELNGSLINCGNKNIEFMISNNIENLRLLKYFNKNKMDINESINVLKLLKNMEFYFQPKIYFANIDEADVSLKTPKMGYFVFSDIFSCSNGLYYVEATLTSRFTCEDIKELYTGWNYTFEIERCSSGYLRFKRIILGTGEASSAHGLLSTIKTLDDTDDCE